MGSERDTMGSGSKQLRVVLIGAGRMGELRAPLLYAHAEVDLAYILDPFEPFGRKLSNEYHCKYVASWAELDTSKVDAVWISTGTGTHEELITQAAALHVPIFCEKPVHETPEGIRMLFAKCSKLCCGFQRRFDKGYVEVKDAVARGAIGKPTLVRAFFADHPCPPLEFLKKGGDPFMDLAPHDIDFICWVLQDVPEEIHATGSSSLAELEQVGVVDTASIHIRFKKGALCSVMMSRGATYGYDQRMEFFGTEGMCAVENILDHSTVMFDHHGKHSPPLKTSFPQRFHEAFKEEVAKFVRTAKLDEPWPVSADDCVLAQSISQCASDSFAKRIAVKFIDPRDAPLSLSLRPVGKGEFGSYIVGVMKEHASACFRLLPPYSPSVRDLSWEGHVLHDDNVDAVYICSPDAHHQSQAIACLQHGKHVLVEKPITPSFEAVWTAYKGARKSFPKKNLALVVGFQRRFDVRFIEAKAYVSNNLQNIRRIVIESRDPVGAVADLSFVLYNSISHDVDMCHWLLPQGFSIDFLSVATERRRSEFQIKGTATNTTGKAIDVSIDYSKLSKTYVQRVHVLVDSGEHRQFGHEFFPEYETKSCFSSYEKAYIRQWEFFHKLCRDGEPDSEQDARVAGYSQTFKSLDCIQAHMASAEAKGLS